MASAIPRLPQVEAHASNQPSSKRHSVCFGSLQELNSYNDSSEKTKRKTTRKGKTSFGIIDTLTAYRQFAEKEPDYHEARPIYASQCPFRYLEELPPRYAFTGIPERHFFTAVDFGYRTLNHDGYMEWYKEMETWFNTMKQFSIECGSSGSCSRLSRCSGQSRGSGSSLESSSPLPSPHSSNPEKANEHPDKVQVMDGPKPSRPSLSKLSKNSVVSRSSGALMIGRIRPPEPKASGPLSERGDRGSMTARERAILLATSKPRPLTKSSSQVHREEILEKKKEMYRVETKEVDVKVCLNPLYQSLKLAAYLNKAKANVKSGYKTKPKAKFSSHQEADKEKEKDSKKSASKKSSSGSSVQPRKLQGRKGRLSPRVISRNRPSSSSGGSSGSNTKRGSSDGAETFVETFRPSKAKAEAEDSPSLPTSSSCNQFSHGVKDTAADTEDADGITKVSSTPNFPSSSSPASGSPSSSPSTASPSKKSRMALKRKKSGTLWRRAGRPLSYDSSMKLQ